MVSTLRSFNLTFSLCLSLMMLPACRAPEPEEPEPQKPKGSDLTRDDGSFMSLTTNGVKPQARAGLTALWLNGRLFVFGGEGADPGFLAKGQLYDPKTRAWSLAAAANQPAARRGHTAVNVGGQAIIWGGLTYHDFDDAEPAPSNSGAVYDVVADQWRATPLGEGTPSERMDHSATVASGQMLIWGGLDADGRPLGDGATFSKSKGWKPVPATSESPSPRSGHSAVSIGSSVLIWGGNGDVGLLGDGARYDLKHQRWTAINMEKAPSPRTDHTAVWIGGRMLVWGGESVSDNGEARFLADGGIYDPATDSWKAMAVKDAPTGRSGHTAIVAFDRYMVVYGGRNDEIEATGGVYDAVTNKWFPLARQKDVVKLGGRTRHGAVWADDVMLVFGGYAGDGKYLDSGLMYSVAANLKNLALAERSKKK